MQTIGSSACGALRRSAIDFAESRLEIRRPTSAGAELPDQRSVSCERWCARRCRGETVRQWVLKFGLAIARRLRKQEPTSSSPGPALGLFTRPVAFVLAGNMAVAYFMAHAPRGFFPLLNGGELAIVYCFVFLYLWVAGGGELSLDRF